MRGPRQSCIMQTGKLSSFCRRRHLPCLHTADASATQAKMNEDLNWQPCDDISDISVFYRGGRTVIRVEAVGIMWTIINARHKNALMI